MSSVDWFKVRCGFFLILSAAHPTRILLYHTPCYNTGMTTEEKIEIIEKYGKCTITWKHLPDNTRLCITTFSLPSGGNIYRTNTPSRIEGVESVYQELRIWISGMVGEVIAGKGT